MILFAHLICLFILQFTIFFGLSILLCLMSFILKCVLMNKWISFDLEDSCQSKTFNVDFLHNIEGIILPSQGSWKLLYSVMLEQIYHWCTKHVSCNIFYKYNSFKLLVLLSKVVLLNQNQCCTVLFHINMFIQINLFYRRIIFFVT